MELIDRYLHAIRPWLPLGSPRDEILRELSEDIRSEVDERRGGRDEIPERELVEILKARGHPVAVAARFGQGDSLVGPRLFPIFRLIVTIGMGYGLLPVLAAASLFMAIRSSHPVVAGIEALLSSLNIAFMVFGVIVTVFVILERYAKDSELTVEWDPRRLPRVRGAREEFRWHAVGIAAGNTVLAIAFTSIAAGLPLLLPGIQDATLAGAFPGPALKSMYESTWRLVVALALLNVAAAVIMLARPALARTCTLVVAAANAILGTIMMAASAPHWPTALQVSALADAARAMKAAGPAIDARQLGVLFGPSLDALAVIFLLAWGIGCLISAFVEAWRYTQLVKATPRAPGPRES